MDYTGLRQLKDADRARIIAGLSSLRAGLSKLPSKGPGNFLLATWNIREFGGNKYGGRINDSFYYIAECISRFDLVAVQEVRQDLMALKRVMRLLGRDWDYIFSDISYADGGNGERLAFVFNKARVQFTGLAGEMVLPTKAATEKMAQLSRTPFICGFQANWAKFNLCTVHIYYGTSKKDDPRRIDEINALAKILSDKAKDYIRVDDMIAYSPENLVLLGDFNIFKREDETFGALTRNKFVVPKQLDIGSNVAQDKYYDQIAFYKEARGIDQKAAGIFDFYKFVFTDAKSFGDSIPAAARAKFKDWRTYQMSDHLIMWTEFDVDKTDTYLKLLARQEGVTAGTTPAQAAKKAKAKSAMTKKAKAKGKTKSAKAKKKAPVKKAKVKKAKKAKKTKKK